jgi:hypothetical protein
MRLQHHASIGGYSALYADDQCLLLSRGADIAVLASNEDTPRWVARLANERPHPRGAHMVGRWLRRMLRVGPRAAAKLGESRYLLATGRQIVELDTENGRVAVSHVLPPGKRPLAFSSLRNVPGFDDGVCFGDYGSNPDKGPMSVWTSTTLGSWRESYRFAAGEIDHVHAVVPDAARSCVWILTGDYGTAAAIWRARDGFRVVERIASGQNYRACALFPLADGLLYATDSHLEQNSIRLLREVGGEWHDSELFQMRGSCLSACSVDGHFAFTTAVEPGEPTGFLPFDMLDPRRGPGIVASECDLVVGNPARGFERVLSWRADFLPKRLFGFSRMLLPSGSWSAARLYVTGVGVRGHDEVTEIFDLRATP